MSKFRDWLSNNIVAIILTAQFIAIFALVGLVLSQRSEKKPDDVYEKLGEVEAAVEALAEDVETLTATVDGEE